MDLQSHPSFADQDFVVKNGLVEFPEPVKTRGRNRFSSDSDVFCSRTKVEFESDAEEGIPSQLSAFPPASFCDQEDTSDLRYVSDASTEVEGFETDQTSIASEDNYQYNLPLQLQTPMFHQEFETDLSSISSEDNYQCNVLWQFQMSTIQPPVFPGMPPFGMSGALLSPGVACSDLPFTHDAPSVAELEAHAARLLLLAEQTEIAAKEARQRIVPTGFEQEGAAAKQKGSGEKGSLKGAPTSDFEAEYEGDLTTVRLANIPNNYTREMVLELLDSEGFKGQYDFFYLPMDFNRWANLGYAFVNLLSNEIAQRMRAHFQGFNNWLLASQKTMAVSWGWPVQGLEANIDRYRNSPVMHGAVLDEYKPVLLKDGARVEFPPPTRRLRPPKMNRSCQGGSYAPQGASPIA